ncbi:GlsB/YeaQ/YmgE family stress response membrane protein [Caenimonas terrae]|uniref:GlsB/YeaQ/YmgE family stress response membrane protein n=1 Tax=Caenimonas terrae TaxID=696074 RepID=A0ABW0N6Q3_9BURK
MELLAGILIGALMGSAAAAMMRVQSSRGVYLHAMLGVVGAAIGGVALSLLFPGSWSEIQDDFLVWCVTGAAGVLALATVANVLELALDLETS